MIGALLATALAAPAPDAYDFVLAPPSGTISDGNAVYSPGPAEGSAISALLGGTGTLLQVDRSDGSREVQLGPRAGLDLAARVHVADGVGITAALPVHAWTTDGPALGDTRLGVTVPLGAHLALHPWLRLPTGASEKSLGHGTVGAGALGALQGGWDRLQLTANLGARSRPLLDELDVRGGAQALVGGAITALPTSLLSVRGEVFGRFSLHHAREGWVEHPVEAWITSRLDLGPVLLVAGGAVPLSAGVGAPAARGVLGLTVAPGQ